MIEQTIGKPTKFIKNGEGSDFYKHWYVPVFRNVYNTGYLHSDLEIYSSTQGKDSKYTGYFKTKKLAIEAIKAYKEKHETKD